MDQNPRYYETSTVKFGNERSQNPFKTPVHCDVVNASSSPASDHSQARHTPDSGIAMSAGYQSSLSPSPTKIHHSDPSFNEGSIVATLNPEIQAARIRSRSLPELNSNVVNLAFVPSMTASTCTPPPLVAAETTPPSLSTHFQEEIHSPELYSPKGTIPLSHAPAIITPATIEYGRIEHPTYSEIPSQNFSSYGPYPPTVQAPSATPANYGSYSTPTSPYLTHAGPASPTLYSTAVRPPHTHVYSSQHSGRAPPTTMSYMPYSNPPPLVPAVTHESYSTVPLPSMPYQNYTMVTSGAAISKPTSTTPEATKVPKPIMPKASNDCFLSLQNSSVDKSKLAVGTPRIIRSRSRADSQSQSEELDASTSEGIPGCDSTSENQQLFTKRYGSFLLLNHTYYRLHVYYMLVITHTPFHT